jgi:hypothetical protein
MARLVKHEKHHAITLREGRREITLVKGAIPYLWIGLTEHNDSGSVYTFGGKASLRKLALAILKHTKP